MAYNITITFPEESHGDGNTIQLIMVIYKAGSGSNQSVDSDDQDLRVTKWGRREFNYDLEDALLVPGTFGITIGDPNKYLHNMIFEPDDTSDSTSRRFLVKLKYNGTVIFEGKNLEDGVEWDEGTLELSFTAAPLIEDLTNLALYEDDNSDINPFGYTAVSYYSLKTILEDLFGVIDSQITYASGNLTISSGMRFFGKRDSDNAVLPEITLDKIYVLIDPLFFANTIGKQGIQQATELLKKLAQDFGCYTGVLSNTRAFFKQLWYYDSDNLQTLGTILAHKKSRPFQQKYYIKTTTHISDPNEPFEYGTFVAPSSRKLERDLLSAFYSASGEAPSGTNMKAVITSTDYHIFTVSGVTVAPAVGDVYSNNGSQFTIIWARIISGSGKLTTERTSGTNDPTASGTLTRVSGSGDASISFSAWGDESGTYNILQVKHDVILGGTYDDSFGNFMALFWYQYLTSAYLRVDYFLVAGVEYDFVKNFTENGAKYQIVKMISDNETNKTEIWALYLGEV